MNKSKCKTFFEKKHQIIQKRIYKCAHKKSLTQLSLDTGAVKSLVHTVRELLTIFLGLQDALFFPKNVT